MKIVSIASLLLALCAGSSFAEYDWETITVLDQYVHSDDGHFRWEEVASYNFDGATLYILNMTSQLWQSEAYSNRPIWWHFVGIAIPHNIEHPEHAMLAIEGGFNTNTAPPGPNDSAGLTAVNRAVNIGIISAYVNMVPNAPVSFYNDPEFVSRTEDRIIAWTWRTFLDSPEPSDPTVIMRMPMTKAGKRGLDTVTEFARQKLPGSNVDKFIITGVSKRGWTSWSLAATDRRVIAQIPLVFSLLNMENGTLPQHNMNMDGGWSFALNPYWRENLTQEFFNIKTRRVWEVEDIYYYKERLTMPTLAVSSTGDEFFLPDDNHQWWHDIPGPHYLMMLPNTDHIMVGHYPKINDGIISFSQSVLRGVPLPKLKWAMEETETGGSITFYADPEPIELSVYSARTLGLPMDNRRDFRLLSANGPHPVVWRQSLEYEHRGPGEYYAEEEKIDNEWVAFFFEGEWEGPSGHRLVLTTQVNIIPNTYPSEACYDEVSCWGRLV